MPAEERRKAMTNDRRPMEREAAITGIGQSAVGRRLNADPLALTADACLEAIADAGLRREEIDGLSTYPGAGITGPRALRARELPKSRICCGSSSIGSVAAPSCPGNSAR